MRVIRTCFFSYNGEGRRGGGEGRENYRFSTVFFRAVLIFVILRMCDDAPSPTKTRKIVLINTVIGVIARLDRGYE